MFCEYVAIVNIIMLHYKESLHQLKEVLIFGETVILLLRLMSQLVFAVPSMFEIMQLLIASILYCREVCSQQAQLYIFFNIFILFILGYNEIYYFCVKVKMEEDSPFIETFKNNYVEWGYTIEGIFRIIGIVIAWRAYQFSEMLENFGDGEDHLADAALEVDHNDQL